MRPFATFNEGIKAEGHANPGAIAGEKLQGFSVFAIFQCISASTRSRKIARLGIDGGPLKTGFAEDFDGFAGGFGHFPNLAIDQSASDLPETSQCIRFGFGDGLPGFGIFCPNGFDR